jgi:cell division protein FtsB
MLDFQRKRNFRKILYSPLVIVLMAVFFVILSSGVWGVYNKSKLSSANLLREQLELAKLEDRQKNLANAIDYLKTEQGLEDEIRTKFRAVKEGERIAVIIDSDKGTTTPAVQTNTSLLYKVFHWPQ